MLTIFQMEGATKGEVFFSVIPGFGARVEDCKRI